MDNKQKMQKAKILNEEIFPLQIEKLISSTMFKIHEDKFNRDGNLESKEIYEVELNKIKSIDNKLLPLFEELTSLQTSYIVEYEAMIMENGILNLQKSKVTINLPIYYDVDTFVTGIDINDQELMIIIKELLHVITHRITSDPTLLNVKTLK